jgi:hypothetical protein
MPSDGWLFGELLLIISIDNALFGNLSICNLFFCYDIPFLNLRGAA